MPAENFISLFLPSKIYLPKRIIKGLYENGKKRPSKDKRF